MVRHTIALNRARAADRSYPWAGRALHYILAFYIYILCTCNSTHRQVQSPSFPIVARGHYIYQLQVYNIPMQHNNIRCIPMYITCKYLCT